MNAEILAVGTELLLGDILNTNAQYLSKELAKLGISVYFQTVVGDNPERLTSAYAIAFGRADMVITTGGLGPTGDDLTKEIAAGYFNRKLVLDQDSLDKISKYFSSNNFQMTDNNKKQAYIPEGARILPNAKGTAPGCLLEADGKTLVMLPGPPMEAIPMFENHVIPYLRKKSGTTLFSRTLRICGVGESALENMLKDLIDAQTNPTIAPYAKTFEVHLRVTAGAKSEESAKVLMQPTIDEIYRRLGDNIYAEGETTLEMSLAQMIEKKNKTVACAESCTGGMLSSRLTEIPGISKIFKEGVVTYSNESKINRLGVKPDTLDRFGAVSPEVAAEMAAGVARTCGADIGISITGIAGPDGGTEEKPVGLVFIGLCIGDRVTTKEIKITGDRQRIRMRTVTMALDYVRRELAGC